MKNAKEDTSVLTRRGLVRVPASMFLFRPLTLHRIQSEILIIRTEEDLCTQELVYIGYSPLFKKGSAEYEVVFDKHGIFTGFKEVVKENTKRGK